MNVNCLMESTINHPILQHHILIFSFPLTCSIEFVSLKILLEIHLLTGTLMGQVQDSDILLQLMMTLLWVGQ